MNNYFKYYLSNLINVLICISIFLITIFPKKQLNEYYIELFFIIYYISTIIPIIIKNGKTIPDFWLKLALRSKDDNLKNIKLRLFIRHSVYTTYLYIIFTSIFSTNWTIFESINIIIGFVLITFPFIKIDNIRTSILDHLTKTHYVS